MDYVQPTEVQELQISTERKNWETSAVSPPISKYILRL